MQDYAPDTHAVAFQSLECCSGNSSQTISSPAAQPLTGSASWLWQLAAAQWGPQSAQCNCGGTASYVMQLTGSSQHAHLTRFNCRNWQADIAWHNIFVTERPAADIAWWGPPTTQLRLSMYGIQEPLVTRRPDTHPSRVNAEAMPKPRALWAFQTLLPTVEQVAPDTTMPISSYQLQLAVA